MPIDFNKFKKDIEREFKGAAAEGMALITNRDKETIGNAAIDEMKRLILKGVSPIEEFGRFPGYKWVSRANQALKVSRSLSGARRARAREKAADIKNKKYPYSVQKKFPDKRERPVNLFLSGDFLYDLIARAIPNGVEIGFATELSEKKESGHRVGVNAQPKRPIIPQGGESFSSSIYRRIVDTVTNVLRQKFRT
jgi:hypothetical protein